MRVSTYHLRSSGLMVHGGDRSADVCMPPEGETLPVNRAPRSLAVLLAGLLVCSGCVTISVGGGPYPGSTVSPGVASPPTGPGVSPDFSPGVSAPPSTEPSASAPPTAATSPSLAPSAVPLVTPSAAPSPSVVPSPSAAPSVSIEPSATATAKPTPLALPTSPPARKVRVSLQKVAGGFEDANGVFHAGDGRLFITEQTGYIRLLKPRSDGTFRDAGIFLDIRDRVVCCGEKGLLGLAFPPDHERTGRFYVTYAGSGHRWLLDERRVMRDDPDRADPKFRRNLIAIYKPLDYHWGGNMMFGPDGYLWIGMGDGGFRGGPGDPGDPGDRAQDLSTIWGKMIRIDPRDPDGKGRRRYGIPRDNPFAKKKGAAGEIWALGLRNPWRWAFDSLTGDLWTTDVGMHEYEEVNRAPFPKLGKGANYGWRRMEGDGCYEPKVNCDPRGELKKPLATYRHGSGPGGYRCAITGGAVYRGTRSPALRSRFIFADYCSGELFSVNAAGPARQRAELLLDTEYAISAVGAGADGELYVVDYLKNGNLYRIVGKPR